MEINKQNYDKCYYSGCQSSPKIWSAKVANLYSHPRKFKERKYTSHGTYQINKGGGEPRAIREALFPLSKTLVLHFSMTPPLFMGAESYISSCTSLSVRSASAGF